MWRDDESTASTDRFLWLLMRPESLYECASDQCIERIEQRAVSERQGESAEDECIGTRAGQFV
jgi:hypothetical protein